MIRPALVLVLCLAVVVPSVASAAQRAQRQPRAATAPTAAPVTLDADPAKLFPADTVVYAEFDNLDAIAEQLGGSDYLYGMLTGLYPSEFPRGGKALLTLEQFRGLVGSRFAVAALPGPGKTKSATPDMQAAVVLSTPSPEIAALVGAVVAENAKAGTKASAPKVVRGMSIRTFTGKNGMPMAVTISGATVLAGDPALVTSVVTNHGKPTFKSLASEPAFVGALNRAPASRQFFGFLNGRPLVSAFNEGLAQGFKTPDGKTKTAELAAVKRFLGVEAITGGSIAAQLEGEVLAVQAALELDRTKGGLVTVLTDPPPISLRAMELFPADTDIATVFSLDLVRLYDLVLEAFTPQLSKQLGVSMPELVAGVEAQLGMKLRDDFLAAFGNEFAVGVRIKEAAANVDIQDPPAVKPPEVDYVVAVEMRNPEALMGAFMALLSAPAGSAAPIEGNVMEEATQEPESHKGVPLLGKGDFRFMTVGSFAVLGNKAGLVSVVDARDANATLSTDPSYQSVSGGIAERTIKGTYLSPRLFEWAAKTASTAAGANAEAIPTFPDGVFISVQKDVSGIYSGFRFPVPNLKALLEKERRKSVSKR